MNFPCIALLTDFGDRDGFTGVMKGVLYGLLNQPVPVTDISHGIEPQNVRQGAWVLSQSFCYFPAQTVFVAVVDPGVGSPDQASLLCWWPERGQIFIAPDNGLLSPVLEAAGDALRIYDIRQSEFHRQQAHRISRTFQGRDIYAPMAALTANALMADTLPTLLATLGKPLKNAVRLTTRHPQKTTRNGGEALEGEIAYADTFGNLITNLPHAWLSVGQAVRIEPDGGSPFETCCMGSYSEARAARVEDQVVLIPSSGGTWELSLFGGSARRLLNAHPGTPIHIHTL